jgi:hypothetical protein
LAQAVWLELKWLRPPMRAFSMVALL